MNSYSLTKYLKPLNKTIGEFYAVQKCQLGDIEALKAWKSRSGVPFNMRESAKAFSRLRIAWRVNI